MKQVNKPEIMAEGRFLRLVRRGGWEYAERTNASAIVVIVALTSAEEVILVEQYREPLQRRVIEFPAGLVGDVAGQEQEGLIAAARRELLEETGYRARHFHLLTEGPPSAGMSNEILTFFLAEEAIRHGPGGGDASEDIAVHSVPPAHVHQWLESQRQNGLSIDPKVYTGLYFVSGAGKCSR